MRVARVIGNVWGTKKHLALEGIKLLLVQTMEIDSGNVNGELSLAVDQSLGAGPGDTVLLVDEGSSARQILGKKSAPVRLAICGIVDQVCVNGKVKKF